MGFFIRQSTRTISQTVSLFLHSGPNHHSDMFFSLYPTPPPPPYQPQSNILVSVPPPPPPPPPPTLVNQPAGYLLYPPSSHLPSYRHPTQDDPYPIPRYRPRGPPNGARSGASHNRTRAESGVPPPQPPPPPPAPPSRPSFFQRMVFRMPPTGYASTVVSSPSSRSASPVPNKESPGQRQRTPSPEPEPLPPPPTRPPPRQQPASPATESTHSLQRPLYTAPRRDPLSSMATTSSQENLATRRRLQQEREEEEERDRLMALQAPHDNRSQDNEPQASCIDSRTSSPSNASRSRLTPRPDDLSELSG